MASDIKITIIDVDLGISIDSIINDSVAVITDQNKAVISEVIAAAQVAEQAKVEKVEKDNKRSEVMQTIFDALSAASANKEALPCATILQLGGADMPNMISFAGRMRNWLKTNKPNYKLTSVKRGQTNGYMIDLVAQDAETAVQGVMAFMPE